MQVYFFPTLKALLYLSLVVIFWIIFGSVSVGRFEKQNVLVSSSTIGPDPEGLQLPAITICRRNTNTSIGWKGTQNPNITSMKEVLRHKCGEDQNVTKCIEKKTFGQGDIYPKKKHISRQKKTRSVLSAVTLLCLISLFGVILWCSSLVSLSCVTVKVV